MLKVDLGCLVLKQYFAILISQPHLLGAAGDSLNAAAARSCDLIHHIHVL